jgi:putative DNA primase/helicase
MDVIGSFIKERCVHGVGELFKVYQEWCEENNEHACSERFLSLRLKELGIKQKRMNDGRYWQGIMVKATLK